MYLIAAKLAGGRMVGTIFKIQLHAAIGRIRRCLLLGAHIRFNPLPMKMGRTVDLMDFSPWLGYSR